MFIPSHFKIDDADTVERFIRSNNFGLLVSCAEDAPFATHMPFLLDEGKTGLTGHLARANPQWQQLDGKRVLAIFSGAHGYISPGWYLEPGVPTWNYQAVHVYGTINCFHETDRLAELVERLSSLHEAQFEQPWIPDYDERMLKAIVGFDLAVDDIQCKFKLSQNRSEADRREVIKQLDQREESDLARAMQEQMD